MIQCGGAKNDELTVNLIKFTSRAHWSLARLTLTSTISNQNLPNFYRFTNFLTYQNFLECDKAKNNIKKLT